MSSDDHFVVVGVDGSEPSLRALRFAMKEARMRGARLRVVHAFVSPTLQGVRVPVEYFEGLKTAAEAVLDDAVSGVLTSSDGEAPEIVRSVVAEGASAALVAESKGADLLVVGSRGLGGFQSLLVGSVSMQCVHHAHCPVTVVH